MAYTKISEDDIKHWLKENLTEKRYLHSLGTADCAKMLANKYNLDSEKAYIAGLLHDSAKCFSTEELSDIIKNHPELGDTSNETFKTLHAPAGAVIASEKFGVIDQEILSAIRWHTLGRLNMTTFEKIIFLADKIESNTREKAYREKITVLLEETNGLDKALFECYKSTIISLVNRKLKINILTIQIYNELLESVIG